MAAAAVIFFGKVSLEQGGPSQGGLPPENSANLR